jgi:hypothetical protein
MNGEKIMSAWDEIHIKQRIELSANVAGQDYNFGSMIVRKNDTSIYFAMPASQHSSKVMRKGVSLSITIHAENKDVGFTSEIAAILPGATPTVQINRPTEDQIQLATDVSAFGLKDKVSLTYRIMRDPVTPISDLKKGETVSISQSDAVIATIAKLTPGNYVEINYTLPDDVQVGLVGKIGECREVKTGAQVSYESRITYEVIRAGEQDKIVKFIFDKQRSLRKRGMY